MSVQTIVAPTPYPFSAREIARRADPAGYRQCVVAGHEDAIAHLEALIREAWGSVHRCRRQRDRSHPESADIRVWSMAAELHAAHLVSVLAIRRALKEGSR